MADIKTVEEKMEECTHNCMSCGSACGENGEPKESKLEKTLYAISDVDEDELLKALKEFTES